MARGRLRSRLGACGLAVLVALALAGCRAEGSVVLDVHADGTGSVAASVALDPAAVAAVGDLEEGLALTDLTAAGWATSITPAADGSAVVRLDHEFESVSEANALLDQLSGPEGPFEGLRLSVDPSQVRDRWRFEGSLDYRAGVASFVDDGLRSVLGQSIDDAAVEAPVALTVSLPGGTTQTWRADPGDSVTVSASSTIWHGATIGLAVVGLTSALAALVLALAQSRRRSRDH